MRTPTLSASLLRLGGAHAMRERVAASAMWRQPASAVPRLSLMHTKRLTHLCAGGGPLAGRHEPHLSPSACTLLPPYAVHAAQVVAHSLGAMSLLVYLHQCAAKRRPAHVHRAVLLTPAGFHSQLPNVSLLCWACGRECACGIRPAPTRSTAARPGLRVKVLSGSGSGEPRRPHAVASSQPAASSPLVSCCSRARACACRRRRWPCPSAGSSPLASGSSAASPGPGGAACPPGAPRCRSTSPPPPSARSVQRGTTRLASTRLPNRPGEQTSCPGQA